MKGPLPAEGAAVPPGRVGDAGPVQARARFVAYLLIVAMLALGVRLHHIQVRCHDHYRDLASRQQERRVALAPRRGDIVSRDGAVLARSVPLVTLSCNPRRLFSELERRGKGLEDFLAGLCSSLDLDRAEVDRLRRRLSRRTSDGRLRGYVVLARDLTAPALRRLRQADLPELDLSPVWSRCHPQGPLAAHVLGFTSYDAAGQDDAVGVGGIEGLCDAWLRGHGLAERLPVDALGRALRPFVGDGDGPSVRAPQGDARSAPIAGSSGACSRGRAAEAHLPVGAAVVSTLDATLQEFLEEALDGLVAQHAPKGVMAVAIDPAMGDVLAWAVRPAFHPDHPGRTSLEALRNRVLTDPFEPGSTIKPLVAARALQLGVVAPQTMIDCENGSWSVSEVIPGMRRVIEDHEPLGVLSFADVIVHSSNIGMTKVGLQMGAPALQRLFGELGFGRTTGLGLVGEHGGKLTSAARWNDYTTTSVPWGYEIAVTPLQLALAYGALVNGGTLWRPRLVQAVIDAQGRRQDFSPLPVRCVYGEREGLALRDILRRTVTEGTGKKAAVAGYVVGGKTGTTRKLPKEPRRYLSSFVGVAPLDLESATAAPWLVVVCIVDEPQHGYYGGQVAAPAMGRFLGRALPYLEAWRSRVGLVVHQGAPTHGR